MTARPEDNAIRGMAFALLGTAAVSAVIGLAVLGGVVIANADPNTQTQLPAEGVLSITRTGDTWTLTTDAAPSEVKLMSPRNEVLCGVNYGLPCTTVVTVVAAAGCTYWQVDGLPGHNSSDPYICLGGTPSSSPTTPTETPSSPSPSTTTTTPATQEPSPSPSPSVTPSPTSVPPTNSTTTPSSTPGPSPSLSIPATPASTIFEAHTRSPQAIGSPDIAPARLADTGMDATPALIVFAVIVILFGAVTVWGRRAGLERFGSESDNQTVEGRS